MHIWLNYLPAIITMGMLVLGSAFFSSSEAAIFYLSHGDRRLLATRGRSGRLVLRLLEDSERLLTAILFWNLLINLVYFTISSITSLSLRRAGYPGEAGLFAAGSLLLLILFSEMLPKSLGVLRPRLFARLFGAPLAVSVRLVDPILPALRVANLLSRRLFWPRFEPESYLRVGDLERAVTMSKANAALLEQEQAVLEQIVRMSETRADEVMRPRTQFLSFRPPVNLADLQGAMPPSGYLLVTEPDTEEVTAALSLKEMADIPDDRLDLRAAPVAYVPWCTTVAEAFESLRRSGRQVAAVVNELGETIGILTRDDILDTLFSHTPSRSRRLLHRAPIRRVRPGVWHVTGMTSLSRIRRHLQVEVQSRKSQTVAGLLQELLERLPREGDQCRHGALKMTVLEATDSGQLLVEIRCRMPEKAGDA